MAVTPTTATMAANAAKTGPVWVGPGQSAKWNIRSVANTITIAVQQSLDNSNFDTIKMGAALDTNATFTAAANGMYEGPGYLQLIASGVAGGGTAVGQILVMEQVAGRTMSP